MHLMGNAMMEGLMLDTVIAPLAQIVQVSIEDILSLNDAFLSCRLWSQTGTNRTTYTTTNCTPDGHTNCTTHSNTDIHTVTFANKGPNRLSNYGSLPEHMHKCK